MSEKQNRRTQEYAKYDAMPTEALEQILRLDADTPEGTESDMDELLYIMELLAQRRRASSCAGKTAQEAYASFRQNYLPEEPDPAASETAEESVPRRRVLLRRLTAAAAAVAIVLLCSATASALGGDVWGAVIRWTQETFYFSQGEACQVCAPTPNEELEYATFQEALICNNVDPDIVPAQLLEGYQLTDIMVEQTPLQTLYTAWYSNGEKTIKITVRKVISGDPDQFEAGKPYTGANGTEYFVYEDNSQLRAVWQAGDYECYISGELRMEELTAMLDTIPKG